MNDHFSVKKQHGVTLLELVILIIVIGVVAVPFASQLLTTSRSLSINNYIQTGVAEARACAEHVLYTKRSLGYDAIANNTICNNLTAPIAPLSRAVTVTNTTSATEPACPTGSSACKIVDIDITVSGQNVSHIGLLFVN